MFLTSKHFRIWPDLCEASDQRVLSFFRHRFGGIQELFFALRIALHDNLIEYCAGRSSFRCGIAPFWTTIATSLVHSNESGALNARSAKPRCRLSMGCVKRSWACREGACQVHAALQM